MRIRRFWINFRIKSHRIIACCRFNARTMNIRNWTDETIRFEFTILVYKIISDILQVRVTFHYTSL